MTRICRVCGKECYGFECHNCYTSGKYASLSRLKVRKRYDEKKKVKNGSTVNSEIDSEIQ